MPVTLVIDDRFDGKVDIRLSPLTELGCALHASLHPDHHPLSAQWISSFDRKENGQLREQLNSWTPLLGAFKARYFTPLSVDAATDIHSEIESIGALDAPEFLALTAQAMVGQNAFQLSGRNRNITWDPDSFMQRMSRYSSQHIELAKQLCAEPERVRQQLTSFLHTVAAGPFADEWDHISGSLERFRTLLLSTLRRDPWELLERLPVTQVDRKSQEVVFEKLYSARINLSSSQIVFVPSRHSAPHIPIKHYPGYPIIISVPVRDRNAEFDDDMESVTARLAALNNPNRLRLCRDLLRAPASTTELAQRESKSPQQISRDLRQLREVGLINAHRHGSEMRYHLDLNTLRRLGTDIISILQV